MTDLMASQFRGLIGAAFKLPEIGWELHSISSLPTLVPDMRKSNIGLRQIATAADAGGSHHPRPYCGCNSSTVKKPLNKG